MAARRHPLAVLLCLLPAMAAALTASANAQPCRTAAVRVVQRSCASPLLYAAADELDGGDAKAAKQARDAAARVEAATAYLKAKQKGTGEAPSGDAAAALLAAKPGPKQAAAKTYLAMRKKQQVAEEYLAARRQEEQEMADEDEEVLKEILELEAEKDKPEAQ